MQNESDPVSLLYYKLIGDQVASLEGFEKEVGWCLYLNMKWMYHWNNGKKVNQGKESSCSLFRVVITAKTSYSRTASYFFKLDSMPHSLQFHLYSHKNLLLVPAHHFLFVFLVSSWYPIVFLWEIHERPLYQVVVQDTSEVIFLCRCSFSHFFLVVHGAWKSSKFGGDPSTVSSI